MTFDELYNKVIDIDSGYNIGDINVAVSTEDGYKIVKSIEVRESIDGVGKFVELVIDG